MAKIILNNEEFNFLGYNRNTYFNGDTIQSNAYISALDGENLPTRLQTLAEDTITSIKIKVNDEIIYNLTNLDAKISNFDEAFNGSDAVNTNVNINFS